MRFIPVVDKICGEFGLCDISSTCSRPLGYDGPLFCLHNTLLEHNFTRAFICESTTTVATTTFTPSTTTVIHSSASNGVAVFGLFLLVLLLFVLSGVLYLQFMIYRKAQNPVVFQKVPSPQISVHRDPSGVLSSIELKDDAA